LVSHGKIGDMQQAQDDLTAALTSFRAGLTIAERLAEADPGNAEWQRDLAVSYGRVALIERWQGARADAPKAFWQGPEISRSSCGKNLTMRVCLTSLLGSMTNEHAQKIDTGLPALLVRRQGIGFETFRREEVMRCIPMILAAGLIALLPLASEAQQQPSCGNPPRVDDRSLKSDLEGKAKLALLNFEWVTGNPPRR
jgi:hypothetical protein